MRTYAIGVDFGTDSARAAVVESRTGALLGSGAAEYPRWKAQCCCDPANQIFRQHPQDFLDALVSCVRQALEASGILLRFVVNVSERNVYSTARILNRDLLLGFRRLGVECPYPQLDVHNR